MKITQPKELGSWGLQERLNRKARRFKAVACRWHFHVLGAVDVAANRGGVDRATDTTVSHKAVLHQVYCFKDLEQTVSDSV